MAQTTPTTSSGSGNRQSGQSGVSSSTSGVSRSGVGMTSGPGAAENRSEFSNNQFIEKLKDVDVRSTMRDLQRRGREYVTESERYIRANPLPVVFGAAGIGMVIGFLMRGKRTVSR